MTARWNQLRAPAYTRKEIVEIAEGISIKFVEEVGLEEASLAISFEALFTNVIYPEKGIEFFDDLDLGNDEYLKKIYGAYVPPTNAIYIDKSLQQSRINPAYRRAFTCGHEVGHAYLHGDWFRAEIDRIGAPPRFATTAEMLDVVPDGLNNATHNRLEVQANLFASHMLVPTWLLRHVIKQTFNLPDNKPLQFKGPSEYSLEVRGGTHFCEARSFQEFCQQIAAVIQSRFGWISKQALGYRIEQSPQIVDLTAFRLHRALATA